MKLDEQARRRLVDANVHLVGVHLSRNVRLPRQPSRYGDYDDLFQEGCVALVEAARAYEPGRHGDFGPYALSRIHYAVSHYLYEGFRVVRIPATVQKLMRKRDADGGGLPKEVAMPWPDDFAGRAGRGRQRPDGPTVGEAWRVHYEAAVREAERELKRSPRCRPGRVRLIERFVEEWLLIPEPDDRVAKRELARQMSCSVGCVNGLERQLVRMIRKRLEDDAEAAELRRCAAGSDEGWGEELSETVRRRVVSAGAAGFAEKFEGAERRERGVVLLAMLEGLGVDVEQVAAGCYRRLDDERRADVRRMVGGRCGE